MKSTDLKPDKTPVTPVLLVLLALVVLAVVMRSPIVMFGSLVPLLKETLVLSDTMIGWLGAIPMPAFALGALVTPSIARRFGLEKTLLAMIIVIIISLVGRVASGAWVLFIGTLVMSVAIGFANALGAPLIKKHAPNHITLATGLFSLCMSVFAGLSAWVIVPIVASTGWRVGMGSWAVIGCLALVLWLMVARYANNITPDGTNVIHRKKFNAFKDINAWALGVFMGLQSLLFYTTASFLPMIGVAKGLDMQTAAALSMAYQLVAPFAIISMTYFIKRGISVRAVGMLSAVMNVAGVLGLIYIPSQMMWWSAMMGFGGATIFTLCLMMFSFRTHDSETARDVSGMVQAVGYGVAFFGPITMGMLYEYYQAWDVPLYVLCGLMVVNVVAGWFATREYMFK